jgi:hypothetical protein
MYMSGDPFLYFLACLVDANPTAPELQSLVEPIVTAPGSSSADLEIRSLSQRVFWLARSLVCGASRMSNTSKNSRKLIMGGKLVGYVAMAGVRRNLVTWAWLLLGLPRRWSRISIRREGI